MQRGDLIAQCVTRPRVVDHVVGGGEALGTRHLAAHDAPHLVGKRPVILLALALSLMHGILEVRDRYHSYAIPLLMPIAALAIVTVVDGARRRLASRAPPAPAAA